MVERRLNIWRVPLIYISLFLKFLYAKKDFDNGETYYKMHGAKLHLPRKKEFKPKPEFITWHNENVYL